MRQNVFGHVWLQVNVFRWVCTWLCVHLLSVFVWKREGVTRRCLGVHVSGENECMGAGLCASVLAVNVIVFWLGLSGAPSSGLVEILAALTSPSLSQFDSWWDLRWNVCVWIASNIHNNLISLLHPSPIFPPSCFHSTPLPPLYLTSVTALSLFFLPAFTYTSQTIHRVQEQCQPLPFGL